MNHLMHPDTFYELNRLYHQERLQRSAKERLPVELYTARRSLKDRALLASGSLLIGLGNSLKDRASQPVCQPQTV